MYFGYIYNRESGALNPEGIRFIFDTLSIPAENRISLCYKIQSYINEYSSAINEKQPFDKKGSGFERVSTPKKR